MVSRSIAARSSRVKHGAEVGEGSDVGCARVGTDEVEEAAGGEVTIPAVAVSGPTVAQPADSAAAVMARSLNVVRESR